MHVSNSARACLEMNLLLQVSSLACLNLHLRICWQFGTHNKPMPDSFMLSVSCMSMFCRSETTIYMMHAWSTAGSLLKVGAREL